MVRKSCRDQPKRWLEKAAAVNSALPLGRVTVFLLFLCGCSCAVSALIWSSEYLISMMWMSR
jgi:ribose/xylose/arabinose/galactoside ABC-type transport system permease subunit